MYAFLPMRVFGFGFRLLLPFRVGCGNAGRCSGGDDFRRRGRGWFQVREDICIGALRLGGVSVFLLFGNEVELLFDFVDFVDFFDFFTRFFGMASNEELFLSAWGCCDTDGTRPEQKRWMGDSSDGCATKGTTW